eukprot:TRINITY_DN10687_c0_g1_i1.p1 TRINITY_DN10687_c0_g1~~TRINITY_DN10687_c0_g1_i1.p1  ORF type:complete len:490 (+),score=66.64 TRINITY_DN10687_c0_g1_i1:38-1507(+)
MKRKTCEPDSEVHNTSSSSNTENDYGEKRRKVERTSRAGGRSRQYLSANRKSVGPELLEDMGVNIIEDASNDSVASSSNSSLKKAKSESVVLKDIDINNTKIARSNSSSMNKIQEGVENSQIHQSSLANQNQFPILSSLYGDVIPSDTFLTYNRQRPVASKSQRPDAFCRMSDEVVLLVFKWLPKCTLARCAVVCRRWCRLIKDDSLWKRVDLGIRTVRPGVVGDVVSRGCVVLRLARSTIPSPIFNSSFSSHSSKLQYLDMSMATIESTCLAKLIKTCKNLKKLALEHCDVNDDVCDGIGQNANLEVLHAAMVKGITEEGVEKILSGCGKLRELNISWTDLSPSGLEVLCSQLPSSVDRLCLAGYRDTLQDHHIHNICNRCPQLIELDVSDAAKITSASITSIVDKCLRLESLSTSRCYGISPHSYLVLVKVHTLLCLNMYGLVGCSALNEIKTRLEGIEVNQYPLSSVARPTIGIKRTSIWNLRVRD